MVVTRLTRKHERLWSERPGKTVDFQGLAGRLDLADCFVLASFSCRLLFEAKFAWIFDRFVLWFDHSFYRSIKPQICDLWHEIKAVGFYFEWSNHTVVIIWRETPNMRFHRILPRSGSDCLGTFEYMESCPSGRRCSTRNAVGRKASRVRIPNSPP